MCDTVGLITIGVSVNLQGRIRVKLWFWATVGFPPLETVGYLIGVPVEFGVGALGPVLH